MEFANGKPLYLIDSTGLLSICQEHDIPHPGLGKRKPWLPVWDLGHLQEAAELVATELTTNSVKATWEFITDPRLPPVRVWLLGSATRVAVLVWDDVAQAPVERVANDDDESGRGLFFVRQFSNEWDFWFPAAPFTGKVTRAIIGQP